MGEATPRPWHELFLEQREEGDPESAICNAGTRTETVVEGTPVIGIQRGPTVARVQRHGDAELIVRAVNNLEPLTKALGDLLDRLDEITGHPQFKAAFQLAALHGQEYSGPQWARVVAAARRALREALRRDET
jgi:hypothetical protein